jgi:hypothetical protein
MTCIAAHQRWRDEATPWARLRGNGEGVERRALHKPGVHTGRPQRSTALTPTGSKPTSPS